MDNQDVKTMSPLIQELFNLVPKEGTYWPREERELWLAAVLACFKLVYPKSDD